MAPKFNHFSAGTDMVEFDAHHGDRLSDLYSLLPMALLQISSLSVSALALVTQPCRPTIEVMAAVYRSAFIAHMIH